MDNIEQIKIWTLNELFEKYGVSDPATILERLGLYGRVRVVAWERLCSIGFHVKVYDRLCKNLIVNTGKDTLLKSMGVVSGWTQTTLNQIGVGNSNQAPSVNDTALIGGSQLLQVIPSGNKTYVRPTLFVSVSYTYTQANFTWNEIGLFDSQGSPALVARQTPGSPLAKTSSMIAIVEWQLSL